MHTSFQTRSSVWRRTLVCAAISIFVLSGSPGGVAQGQVSFEILHDFVLPPIEAGGSLLQATDGNFYGTSYRGGAFDKGAIFRVTPSGVLTTLHSFTGSEGASPRAPLIQASDGTFYGTTAAGGAFDRGTVFQFTQSGTLTTIYNFTGGSDGYWPNGGLIQGTDGSFYGTTPHGGTAYGAYGTVFRLTSDGTFTTLHSFSGTDGQWPEAGLMQAADGNVYGTTRAGGASAGGTVFRLTSGGVLTTLHSFSGTDGQWPEAGLMQAADGNVYGTTIGGGVSNQGVIFRLTPSGNFATLHSFTGPEGQTPRAPLVQTSDGIFYGTTYMGGASAHGTVFRFTPDGTFTTLHSFAGGSDGANPTSSLIRGTDGNLYGTTSGTVFRLSTGGTFTTLLWLSSPEGSNPIAGLWLASDGHLYGTTTKGGPQNVGTVFRLTTNGTHTTLYSFAGPDGAIPYAALMQGSDGNFYGTTSAGGAADKGTVFQLTPSGTLTMLYSFAGPDGAIPYAALMQGSDGNFYGTTSAGGAADKGTVFQLTPSGTLTMLYSFAGGSQGARPQAGLLQASDGNFYGTTTSSGDSWNYGTVFRLTPSGVITILYRFVGRGDIPVGGLIQGGDGALYGTTNCVGLSCGMIYRITLDGVFTTLHNFIPSEGGCSSSGLLQAGDGNLYVASNPCSTSSGNSGTVLRVTPSGSVTIAHAFSGVDGATPVAGLIEGSDGSFYGTTEAGGPNGGGVVFALRLGGTLLPLNVNIAGPGSGSVGFGNAGASCVTSCSVLYASGSSITLSGTAAAHSVFAGWGGACSGAGPCTVSLTSETTVTATFARQTFPLTVTRAGTGTGTITSNPAGINCGEICSQNFSYGTGVLVTATAAPDSIFAGWSGAGCWGISDCMVVVTESRTVTATFNIRTPPETTILSGPTGTISDNWVGFSWTGSDDVTPVANLYYASRLDPVEPSFSTFQPGAMRTYSGLANGNYTFYVKAQDQEWTEDPTPASRSFTVNVPSSYDPLVGQQWHLKSQGYEMAGADVLAAWATTKGAGVVIGIVDDGLQYTHPDLQPNYVAGLSWDFNGNDPDPSPGNLGPCDTGGDCHGTAVAGVAAAREGNGIGVGGVAPEASLAGIRLIAEPMSDAQVAEAIAFQLNGIHVVNNSWGFVDALAALDPLSEAALETAVTQGRGGRGRIIVKSAGNNGVIGDNCNFDGFASNRFVIAVGALNDWGRQASYSEPCSSLFVTAPSSDAGRRGITTTDLVGNGGYDPSDYAATFGGTSASAAIVSGVVALMLAENPTLSWRDAQYILARSALKVDPNDHSWTGGTFGHHEKYGFGLVDAMEAVRMASTWTNVSPEFRLPPITHAVNAAIPDNYPAGIVDTIAVDSTYSGFAIEHVEVVFDAAHSWRGDLEVTLTSPAGVVSHLATPRGWDDGQDFPAWRFGSVRHWGETATGTWTLRVADREALDVGTWRSWTLRIYGTLTNPSLTVSKVGSGAGRVTSDPIGIDCGVACLASFSHGTNVTLTATPDPGYIFSGWSGAGCSGTGTCTINMDTVQTVTATFAPEPLVVDDFTADRTSPQTVGTAIVVTAAASGGTAPYQYRFWLHDGDTWTMVQDWATSNTYTWAPSTGASYRLGVWVKSAGVVGDDPKAWAALPFTITPPTVTLAASLPSPQPVGTPIPLTATATAVTNPTYRFWVDDGAGWTVAREWGGSTFTWTPSGAHASYRLGVWVKSSASPGDVSAAYGVLPYTTSAATVTLAASLPSPQPVGTPIPLTATATAVTNPTYRFWVDDGAGWTVAREWGGSTFTWTPSGAHASYRLGVWVKSSASPGDVSAAYGVLPYTTSAATVTLAASLPSPQPVGTPIPLTATATAVTNPTYRFWVDDGAGWTVAREWGGSTFTWTPSGAHASYRLGVWVKSSASPGDVSAAYGVLPFVAAP